MSLEAVLSAIRDLGEDQVKDIDAAAHSEVQDTTAQNKAETQRLRQEARETASALGAAERSRILNQARLEAQSVINDVREELIDDALNEAYKSLTRLRKDPVYKDLLRQLIEETLTQISGSLQEGEIPRLEADPRDKALYKRILSDLKLKLDVDYKLDCLGGLIAKSEDGRVVVNNTLDTRLIRATLYLRRSLGVLFGANPSEPVVD